MAPRAERVCSLASLLCAERTVSQNQQHTYSTAIAIWSFRQLCFAALSTQSTLTVYSTLPAAAAATVANAVACMLLCARGRAQILQCGQAWQTGNNLLTAASMNI